MKYNLNNQHLKSDFCFRITAHVIAIKDLNLGKMSVTNNIEAIVEYICEQNSISPLDFTIIYKDSNEDISLFSWFNKEFYPINSFLKNKALKLLP